MRLQQLLSLLDYSPLAFHPSSPPIPPSDLVAQRAALFHPPADVAAALRALGREALGRALQELRA
jgi:hypothetical protein